MATDDQVAAVKLLLPSADNQTTLGVEWDDATVGTVYDLEQTVTKTVRAYWNSVLANTAMYMDVSESGSSRTLSQPWRNAWEMVQRWDRLVTEEETKNIRDVTGSIRFGRIKRT